MILAVDGHLRHRGAGIAVLRQHMGQDLGAVQTVPPEGVPGEAVGIVHGELIGGEIGDPRLHEELRQCGAVAEDIGQEAHLHIQAELLAEEPLAVEQLAHQGFAGGQIGVALDPEGAHHLDPLQADLLQDPFIEVRVVFLQPDIGGRLAEAEFIVREPVHHLQDVCHGPGVFPVGLPLRPQEQQV